MLSLRDSFPTLADVQISPPLATQTGQTVDVATTANPTENDIEPVVTPEAKPDNGQAADESSTTAESTLAKEHKADFQLRAGCMLPFDESRGTDRDYVDYYKKVQKLLLAISALL